MSSQLSVLLELAQLSFAGRKQVSEHLRAGLSPAEISAEILSSPEHPFYESLHTIRNSFCADKEMDVCARQGIRLLTLMEDDYPQTLKAIYNPPLVLYVKGSLIPEDRAAAALVGTRHPSVYGITQARRFARGFAEKGMTVVSGFAKGIDQASHQAAIEIPFGRTLAVLGCGLDVMYPPHSEALAEKIIDQGALISEYPLGTPPLAHHFPSRNRIIAGLSHAVVVIEAHYRSGSLITAHEALEEGKEVFAVPGPVDQITSQGSHRLIKEGAYLAESPEDVMEVLTAKGVFEDLKRGSSPAGQAPSIKEVSEGTVLSPIPAELPLVSELMEVLAEKPCYWEELKEKLAWTPEQLTSELTLLELSRKICKRPDGAFAVSGG